MVPDLRIEEQGRIRGPGHEGVALVDGAVVLALAALPVRGQEVKSVDAGHRPLSSLLVSACSVEALGLDVIGLVSRIDTSHAVDCSRRNHLRSVDRYQSRRQRTHFPARRGDRRDR